LVKQRTAKINQIRGLLAEYGVVENKLTNVLRKALPLILEDVENGLSVDFRILLEELRQDLITLDERISTLTEKINVIAKADEDTQRLQQIPGVGPITATAIISAVGDGKQFKCGRDLAAWLGLTPKQHSSGGKERLLGISKRGDAYLRTLLIHGARSVLRVSVNKKDSLNCWLQDLCDRRNKNIAAVALASKNARIIWAILTKKTNYQMDGVAA
jgi:transposase